MAPDDLNAPLGQVKPKRRSGIGAPQVLAAILALFGVVVAGWATFVDDPLGGEPIAVVSAKPSAGETGPRQTGPLSDAEAARAAAAAAEKAKETPPGANTVTIIDGSSGNRQEVIVPAKPDIKPDQHSSLEPVDPRLLEATRFGALPTIGPDGARAFTVYAKPRVLTPALKDFPRIALVVGGMGISAAGTADAFLLPASVTFALSPHAADVEKLAERARAEAHEVLLQVPMEPYDYPDNDPGPQTLLTSLPSEQNIERLHWLMGRFRGYIGLVGSMGGRFAAAEQAFRPVLTEAARRGLMYLDNGASTRSTARQIALTQNMPFARAGVVLDALPGPKEVDRALARLELAARETGSAVGIITAQSETVARIAAWAKEVESRGFVLVPISMVAARAGAMQRAAKID